MASKNSNGFYCYVHRKNSDGLVFYVGKGHGQRAYTTQSRSKHWHSVVAKHGYTVEIVIDRMPEDLAFELEIELIAFYGLENLCNILPGGQGSSEVSAKTRALISRINKGKVLSDATKAKLRAANLGKKQSPETRRKVGDKLRGRKHTPAALEKMKQAQSNRSEETRKKSGDARRGINRPQHVIDAIVKRHSKPVICKETGQAFSCCVKAAEWLHKQGYPKAQGRPISDCSKGKYSTAYGHTWKYA